MFKVIIIDDEPIIRKGLKNIINWKQYDCTVCAEASDGEEGKQLIEAHRPDILITDIRMPEMDGLNMIREVKEYIPDCKIIILTGYRDFDYVQEAIKLGAFDFVLKPSKIEELAAVVKRAVDELKCQRNRVEEMDKLRRIFEQNIPVLREKFLYDGLYEINSNNEDITAKAELLGIEIGRFILLAAEIDNDDDKIQNRSNMHLYQFGIINLFEEVFSDYCKLISVSLSDNSAAFILQLSDKESNHNEIINNKCAYIQDMAANCFGFTISVAVSSEGGDIMQLPEKLKECREALEYKFYLGSNAIIFHSDLNGFFKYKDYSLLEKYRKMLIEGIKTGNEGIVKKRLEDIFDFVGSLDNIDAQYLKTFYLSIITYINNIHLSVAQADNEKKPESMNIPGLHEMVARSETMDELNYLLKEVSLSITAKINNYNNRNIKLVLRKAIDYINEHYTEQITLNDVAENVYVSSYYISRMFKKELGKNFVDYLNGLRMEKAKELLKDPKYKTYLIAELVGIPDAHYFSRLFKKHEGVTPTEYRDMC